MNGSVFLELLMIVLVPAVIGAGLADSFSKKRKRISRIRFESEDSAALERFQKWQGHYGKGWKSNRGWALSFATFFGVSLFLPYLGLFIMLLFIFYIISSIYHFSKARKIAKSLGFKGRDALMK